VAGSRSIPLAGVLICIWDMLVLASSTAVGEVFAAKHASLNWGWNVEHTSLFLAGIMACVGLMTLSAGGLVRAVEDRKGVFGVCSLAIPFCVSLFDFNLQSAAINTSMFSMGLIAIFAASSIARAFLLAMMTKIVPPHLKGSITSMGMLALCAGRGMGFYLGPLLHQESFAIVQLVTFASTGILNYFGANSLKRNEKAC